MAIRNIRKLGEDILRKKCRVVETIDDKITTLLDDMIDTMQNADGVGLAAPQVGILKRIAVIDVGEGVIELINPEIIKTEGKETNVEGCLSVPGKWGTVERPQKVTVRATGRDGNEYEITGEGLLARALCHEIDHLDGVVFVDKVEEYVEMENQ
jgi:peptide deformylase